MSNPTPKRPQTTGGAPARALLSISDAATVLSLSIRQVRRLIDRSDLPHIRISRRVLIHPDDLEAFIAKHRHARPLVSTNG